MRNGRVEEQFEYAQRKDISTRDEQRLVDGSLEGFIEVAYPLWLVSRATKSPKTASASAHKETVDYKYGHLVRSKTSVLLGFTSIVSSVLEKSIEKSIVYQFFDINGVSKALPAMLETYSIGNGPDRQVMDREILSWIPIVNDHGGVRFEVEQETEQNFFEQGGGYSVSNTIRL